MSQRNNRKTLLLLADYKGKAKRVKQGIYKYNGNLWRSRISWIKYNIDKAIQIGQMLLKSKDQKSLYITYFFAQFLTLLKSEITIDSSGIKCATLGL